MRRGRALEVATGQSDILWPFAVFYELLRISFFISLLEHLPTVKHELKRLEVATASSLCASTSAELYDSLMHVKPSLLDVSHEKPLTEAEAAYDQLFDRIMLMEPAPS
jgi:hypothetical protein